MTGTLTDRARRLAAELERLFPGDVESAKRLNDAHQRFTAANEELGTGLHPKGPTAGYGDNPEFETIQLEPALNSRSEIVESADPLGQHQQAHWQIHKSHLNYHAAAGDRRQLAADSGEAIARFVDELVGAGWLRGRRARRRRPRSRRRRAADDDCRPAMATRGTIVGGSSRRTDSALEPSCCRESWPRACACGPPRHWSRAEGL